MGATVGSDANRVSLTGSGRVYTNTSAQIRRNVTAVGINEFNLLTYAYVDTRGRG
jgi:hypothetical protein